MSWGRVYVFGGVLKIIAFVVTWSPHAASLFVPAFSSRQNQQKAVFSHLQRLGSEKFVSPASNSRRCPTLVYSINCPSKLGRSYRSSLANTHQLRHMEMHCLVGTYLHAKFQRNRPNNYQDIAIGTKLTPLRFARGTRIRGHPHTSGIVQYLEEGMKLPYKKDPKWIGPVVAEI